MGRGCRRSGRGAGPTIGRFTFERHAEILLRIAKGRFREIQRRRFCEEKNWFFRRTIR
jgi:hypothetical protein